MRTRQAMPIDDVEPGSRLADSLCDVGGRVLVPAGAELTDRLLEALRRRGIDELVVEREAVIDHEALAALRARIDQRLARRFRKAGDGLETRLLYQAVHDFCLEHEA